MHAPRGERAWLEDDAREEEAGDLDAEIALRGESLQMPGGPAGHVDFPGFPEVLRDFGSDIDGVPRNPAGTALIAQQEDGAPINSE